MLTLDLTLNRSRSSVAAYCWRGWGWDVGSVLVVLGVCIVCLNVWGATFGCFFLAFASAAGDVRASSVVWVRFILKLLVRWG